MSGDRDKPAVLLLAHGSPDSPLDVPEFLRNITGGRALPPATIDEVTHRYSLIGRSPLTDITLAQATGVSRLMSLPVYVGMRNWKPFVADALEQMARDGITRAVVICLAPQNSRTSVGLYRKSVMGTRNETVFPMDFVESWHDHPMLVRAFAENLSAGWERACAETGRRVPVIFTAHSVPERTISEGDPYEQQAKQTATLVAEQVSLRPEDWAFAFQSQGMSGGAWLGPKVEETILQLKAAGHAGVFVQPIGFLCDHVEILYDIDIAFQEFAGKQGMRLWRAESLNESPLLLEAIADIARTRLAAMQIEERSASRS
ncbi:MAG: ferrochelatase [Candidatus Korobacteraceae bacterium]